jgi:hypothetical protein
MLNAGFEHLCHPEGRELGSNLLLWMPLICKEFLNSGACDRVRTLVRPVRAADERRWPRW